MSYTFVQNLHNFKIYSNLYYFKNLQLFVKLPNILVHVNYICQKLNELKNT